MLDVRDVSIGFDGRRLLDRVALGLDAGEVVALLGPSGSGKSTLLRIIAGLIAPQEGSVWIDGADVTDVPTHRRSVGMVFQDEQLFPHLSVADNVGFGLKMAGLGRSERRARVDEMLDLVGLRGFGDRRVGHLSGGEAKRVALARSLAPRPRVLLLDEPLTGLDRELHHRLTVEVAAILRRAGTTAVWVTHDPEEAAAVADRVVRLGPPVVRTLPAMGVEIVELRAVDTHPLRRSILRTGTPSSAVEFEGDELATTFHLGAVADGEVIAIATWLRRPLPGGDDRPAVQLRGMATAPAHRGSGVSSAVLDAGVERCRREGIEVVWARARVAALGFYRRAGFETIGEPYVDATTALAHHDIVLSIA